MRALIRVAAVGVLLAGAAWLALGVPAVQDAVLRRVAARQLAASPSEFLFEPDALRVLLCGSASPLPHPTRARPCTAVFAGGRVYVVDVGPGAWNRLALWRIDGARIGAVLLTHFHSDHVGELGEFDLQTWVAGRPGPLRVLGPQGVERVVAGFEQAYSEDARVRIAHHGPELLSPSAEPMEPVAVPLGRGAGSERAVVLEEGGLTITAFSVDHRPVEPAVGYRFDLGGRSVVVSGDTVAHPGLVEVARGADVLVHEAQANHVVAILEEAARAAGRARIAKVLSDIPDYHTTPVEAARVANEAGVGLLLLTHLTPPPTNRLLERVFVRGVDEARPEGWQLGEDGLLVELPLDGGAARVRELDP